MTPIKNIFTRSNQYNIDFMLFEPIWILIVGISQNDDVGKFL